jgi:hypothetical protein
MRIMGLGIDYDTGEPLMPSVDEERFAELVQQALGRNVAALHRLRQATDQGESFRSELERRPIDLGDPKQVGWTFLIRSDDPRRDAFVDALRPLALHRGMEDPDAPLVFHGGGPDEWFDWFLDSLSPLRAEKVPHYVLIVGGPDQVPFRFQSLLDSAAAAGRVDFETIDELKTYVGKVIRLEAAESPATGREVVFFAPDGGVGNATYFSRHYMAEPLEEEVRRTLKLPTHALMGRDATKARLLDTLRASRPALVYTAGHGMVAPHQVLEVQKKIHGAICCQRVGSSATADWLFSADDVPPAVEPFLEGAVFFQFACFGYGTPAESDYSHWRLGEIKLNAEVDFTAALPRRLLGHPRGPLAYIGHVDAAWLHAFDDPHNPYLLDRWHPRIAPFLQVVRMLLECQPAALSLADMHKRYNITNAILTDVYDRDRRGQIQWTKDLKARLSSTFITRNDAQNYMVFGDPAAALRIPD